MKRKQPTMRQKLDAALYQLGLDPKTAQLHHSPPLAMRMWRTVGERNEYSPAENDPRHMVWMTKAAHKKQTIGVPATTVGSDMHSIAKMKRIGKRPKPPRAKTPLLRRKLYEKGTAK